MNKIGKKIEMRELKNRIKRRISGLKKFKIKTWILILVLIPLGFLIATLMRNNHIKMTELRDAVMAADEENDDQKIEETLISLKEFVFSDIVINITEDNGAEKISFGTGPFYLEHQYLRAAEAALAKAEAEMASDENPNGNIYGMAGETCRALALKNGWTWDNVNFINCMVTEINKYPAADEIQDTIVAALPDTELYRHNYASPVWAPTITGFMILIFIIIVIIILIRGITWLVLRLALLFV